MLGESLALAAALSWATSVILFKRSEAIQPQALNLYKSTLAIVFLLATLLVTGGGIDWQRSAADWWRLGISGVIGIAVADSLFFYGLRRLGPGLMAIIDCFYAPFVVLLAVVALGERPGAGFLVGSVLVVSGIGIATTDRSPLKAGEVRLGREHLGAVIAGIGCMATMAAAVVIAKPAIERSGLVEVTLVRLLIGTPALLLWVLLGRRRFEVLSVFRPAPVWRTLVPASILGAYLSTLCWIGGFKWAEASLAAVLNQTATVFIIVLGRVLLGEVVTARRALGAAAAATGAVLVLLA